MINEFKGPEIIASSLLATSAAIQKERAGSPRRGPIDDECRLCEYFNQKCPDFIWKGGCIPSRIVMVETPTARMVSTFASP
jgi:hypothetical protein